MKEQTRTKIEYCILLLSVVSSVITIFTFATGTADITSCAAMVKTYVTSIVADSPVVIRWPIKAIAWVAWYAVIILYRLAILFGLPLIPVLPIFLVTERSSRLKNWDPSAPLYCGFVVYTVALICFIIALNSNPAFSMRLGMG